LRLELIVACAVRTKNGGVQGKRARSTRYISESVSDFGESKKGAFGIELTVSGMELAVFALARRAINEWLGSLLTLVHPVRPLGNS